MVASMASLGMAMPHQQVLVPGRECGPCDVCCVVLQIDTGEIQKASGERCRHCLPSGGCGIHQARPAVCAGFYCAWRVLDMLGPDWRPDKSGVFAQLETENIPPQFPVRSGISLMLTSNPLKTVRERWFQEFVGKSVVSGIPLFLSLPGPHGHLPAKIMLNSDEMLAAAASRVGGRIREQLELMLKCLAAHPFERHVAIHSGNPAGT